MINRTRDRKDVDLITLNRFVELTRPEKVVIYDGVLAKAGNRFSDWGTIARNTSYLLSKLGVPNLVLSEHHALKGYKSTIREALEQKAVTNEYEDKPYEDLIIADEDFVGDIMMDSVGLWVPGCLCCLGPERVSGMARYFGKNKAGVLISRDRYYLDSFRGKNSKFQKKVYFVAPELEIGY